MMTVSATTTVGEVPEHEEDTSAITWAWDDANNKALNPEMVRQAREEEMKYINEKRVWDKMSKSEALKLGYKLVATR